MSDIDLSEKAFKARAAKYAQKYSVFTRSARKKAFMRGVRCALKETRRFFEVSQ